MRVTPTLLEDARLVADEMRASLQPLAGTTMVVTGAAGFLASHVLDVVVALNEAGLSPPCRVLAVDNFKTGLPDRVAHLEGRADIRFIRLDLSRPLGPDGGLPQEVDWIIHAASIASPPTYRAFPLETVDVNVTGTRSMLDLAHSGGARSMLFLSTSEIYGDPPADAIPTPETYRGNVSSTGPRACYDESKRLGETLCTIYHRLHGTPVKMARPFNVYGPGQRLDDGRIIPDLMSAALKGRPLVLYSDGRATRSFCYVRDAVRGMLSILCSSADGEPFNLGNDEEVSIGEVARLVSEIAASPPLPVQLERNPDTAYLVDNPQRRCPDLSKLRALGSWAPRVGLAEGLTRTLRSYRELAEAASE